MLQKSKCSGCENNFYNGNNVMGIQECWYLKDGYLQKRWRISVFDRMDKEENYTEVNIPRCFTQKGYVFLDTDPKERLIR